MAAQNIAVGMPVEIKPDISPDVFGAGGILSRDEYGLEEYQTNIANVERLGSMNNPDLPSGTVLVCHDNKCSIYSINHVRPYEPEENNINNRNNRSTNAGPNNRSINNSNSNNKENKGGYELFGFKLFGGKRRKTYKKSRKSKKTKKNRK